MPIQVTCPGCHARFKVSDKFAGQKGPCPKCKQVIRVPTKDEEVVIHAPEHSEAGAKDATGKLVLKPIERTETTFNPLLAAGFGAFALLSMLVALVMRGSESIPTAILGFGALFIAPPICWGSYQLLRDDEQLEAISGQSLWIRTAACSVLYAALWGAFAYFYWLFLGTNPVEIINVMFIAPPFLAIGALIAFCCYDFDFGTGLVHYSFYLCATILLRLLMGLPAIGPSGG